MANAYVLGAGVAGLNAAFAAAEGGFRTTLIEAHPWLGGRAFSLPKRVDVAPEFELDNGPHVMLGCYDHTIELCRRLGTVDGFVQQSALRVDYRDARGRASCLALQPWLPAPLAMGPAMLAHGGFSVASRTRALAGLGAVLAGAPRGWSFADWLRRRGQQGAPSEWIWLPMCRAIMNAEPDRVSARLFLATLRRAFLGSAKRAAMWLPDRPWSALIGEPAHGCLEAAGVGVRVKSRVAGIDIERGRVVQILIASGESIPIEPGDVVICALPWSNTNKLLPHVPSFELAATLEPASITSAWFFLERVPELAVAPPPSLTALVGGGPFHFLYRRPSESATRFALLNGGGEGVDGVPVDEIAARARTQAKLCFPELAPALDTAAVRVTKEAAATIVARPGSEELRPTPGLVSGIANLAVCGDWTATGLPSTLEGAAESGVRCVARVLAAD